MGEHHSHGHHQPGGAPLSQGEEVREKNRKGLRLALFITAGIMVLEFVGGLLTNSLALISDAGHMLSDSGSLLLSLLALRFASKPATKDKTYGYYRLEILAALANGATLFVIAGVILREAIQRFSNPPPVAGPAMLAIAAVGMAANLASAWALLRQGDVKHNVNLRSAYLHVLSDALGSVGALTAGVLVMKFRWYIADPIISVLVALLILRSGWGILGRTIHILMEGTPPGLDPEEIRLALASIQGVADIHDLHVWTVTSGLDLLTCHIQTREGADDRAILEEAGRLLDENYGIRHTTIQIEPAGWHHQALDI